MKLIYTQPNYKIFNSIRALKSHRQKARHKKWKKNKNRKANGKTREQIRLENKLNRNPFTKIAAPIDISLKRSTDDFIKFINKIRYTYQYKKSTHIDFSSVEFIDKDSVVVIVAALVQHIAGKVILKITRPKNKDINNILIETGLYKKLDDKYIEANYYRIRLNKNTETLSHRKVDFSIAERIVVEASKYVWGEPKRCPGLYKVLIELMHNTHNHANKKVRGQQNWWLSIIEDNENKVVKFSFVDFGLGIIRNLDNKKQGEKFYNWRKILQELVLTKVGTVYGRDVFMFGFIYSAFEPEYLRLLLEGSLHKEEKRQKSKNKNDMRRTSTNLYYRGKGLPTLKQTLDRNHIKKLFGITNNVRADIDNNLYEYVNEDFSGTFFSWELDADCFNLPINFIEGDDEQ
ncbi:hypothetical protein [Hymenobacter volaticus]|uniref:ATP-binding protein n=1 Tax=Hymenobacter volaticus TaxID=2932254 RepID=A0ABY4G4Z3_9BACT|nr:hypothetical protein [Hymenobacter volaticus]UOQ65855.1 hypothetical protein MUN86_20395 [Hymenobacter volaticus]